MKILLAIITFPIYLPICLFIGVCLGIMQGFELVATAFNSIARKDY